MSTATNMYREAASAASVVARQLQQNATLVERIGDKLRKRQPQVILTCARGSSDHAATYAKYMIETHVGIPTASFAPSVTSVYEAKQAMQGAVFIVISQSGKSPDLLASAEKARDAGALVIALVNVTESPLAELADEVIPLCAGREISVAATKSYIATLTAIAQLVASWSQDRNLELALDNLPTQLDDAWNLDWQPAVAELHGANNLFVIGRGIGLSIAQEAALKFKETAGLHAEAYSAAEVRHGPMAIVNAGFPVLLFTQDDGTRAGADEVVEDFVARGAIVMAAGNSCDNAINLPTVPGISAATAPVALIQSFYKMVNALAVSRGFDPDRPPHLKKVTETV